MVPDMIVTLGSIGSHEVASYVPVAGSYQLGEYIVPGLPRIVPFIHTHRIGTLTYSNVDCLILGDRDTTYQALPEEVDMAVRRGPEDMDRRPRKTNQISSRVRGCAVISEKPG